MRIVHHHQGVVPVRKITDLPQRRDHAVHGKHAVSRDQFEARPGRGSLAKIPLQIREVSVPVAVPPRLAEPDPVDDAGMVEFVADHGVLRPKQGFEQTTVGVEARAVEDGVLGPEEFAQPGLELLVDLLRPADEAHARQPVTPLVQRGMRRLAHPGILRQPEIVVGAQVQHGDPAVRPDMRTLGGGQHALVLVGARVAHGGQLVLEMLLQSEVGFHDAATVGLIPRSRQQNHSMRGR